MLFLVVIRDVFGQDVKVAIGPSIENGFYYDFLRSEPFSPEDFEKIDIRCGTIISANDFEKARNPSYQLEIDFGDLGIRKSSAQITSLYRKEELIGLQVLAVVNFPKKQIANFFSECLVLGVYGEDKKEVTLLTPSLPVKNGMQVG